MHVYTNRSDYLNIVINQGNLPVIYLNNLMQQTCNSSLQKSAYKKAHRMCIFSIIEIKTKIQKHNKQASQ